MEATCQHCDGTTFDASPVQAPKRWHLSALCVTHPDWQQWTEGNRAGIARAIAVCKLCPVRQPCAEEGRGESYGVWGGEWRGGKTDRYVPAR